MSEQERQEYETGVPLPRFDPVLWLLWLVASVVARLSGRDEIA